MGEKNLKFCFVNFSKNSATDVATKNQNKSCEKKIDNLTIYSKSASAKEKKENYNKSHNKSFNIGTIKNEEISDILDISNQKEKTNIKITIKKIKRSSADNTRSRLCNNEDSGLCSSNDIDIFQKMNTGIKSLISKFKILRFPSEIFENRSSKVTF